MVWQQIYDPFNNMAISTLAAAVPVAVMLIGLGFMHLKAHVAAGAGLAAAIAIAIIGFGMPTEMAAKAAILGGLTGLMPIGWIVLNIIFLHQLTERNGSFKVLQDSIAGITEDRRLQLLLISFAFGAFFEGAAGFGTPVAVTAAILIGLGFSPLAASGLSLIANTAPVAYGALGTPVITLAKVHGYDLMSISAMIGRQLPFFSLLVPFWLIWAFAGRRGMMQIWPAILVTGVSFAVPQFLVSNYIGPELVDVIAAMSSMICLVLFLRVWKPKQIWRSVSLKGHEADSGAAQAPVAVTQHPRADVIRAWTPWVILTVFVFIWGLPVVKGFFNGIFAPEFKMNGLHLMIEKVAPVVSKPTKEGAIYVFSLLSATGTGILFAAIVGGITMKYSVGRLVTEYGRTVCALPAGLCHGLAGHPDLSGLRQTEDARGAAAARSHDGRAGVDRERSRDRHMAGCRQGHDRRHVLQISHRADRHGDRRTHWRIANADRDLCDHHRDIGCNSRALYPGSAEDQGMVAAGICAGRGFARHRRITRFQRQCRGGCLREPGHGIARHHRRRVHPMDLPALGVVPV